MLRKKQKRNGLLSKKVTRTYNAKSIILKRKRIFLICSSELYTHFSTEKLLQLILGTVCFNLLGIF